MFKDLKTPQVILISVGMVIIGGLLALKIDYAPFLLGVAGFLTLLGFTAKQISDTRAETAAQAAKTDQVLVQTNGNNKALVDLLAKQHADHMQAMKELSDLHRSDMTQMAAWLAQSMPPPGGLSAPPERPLSLNGSSVVGGADGAAASVVQEQ